MPLLCALPNTGGAVLVHYYFGRRLLTEMGIPKALMVVPVRMPEWLVRYKDVIKQD